jgi:DNA-binding Xre family transcriptional regulator
MNLPDKHAIAQEIRVVMAQKNVTATELAQALGVSKTSMTAIRYGNSSYELMKKTIDTLDRWDTPNHLGHIFGDVTKQLEDL